MPSHTDSPSPSFDLVRLGKTKDVLDITKDTLREWSHRPGGPRIYYAGKTAWVSAAEVAAYIRSQSNTAK